MTLRVDLQPRDTYLAVFLTGSFEPGDVQTHLIKQVLDACAELRLSRILLDLRPVQGELSTMDRWNHFEFLAHQIRDYSASGRLRGLRLAYLGTPSQVDSQGFGETVAVNRGIDLRATTELEEALSFLGVDRAHKTGGGGSK